VTLFLQNVFNGLMLGSAYCLMASGLTLIFGILDVANFAQGALYMLAAVFTYLLTMSLGCSYWIAILAASIALAIIGLGIERVFFRPLRSQGIPSFVVAIGLLTLIEGLVLILFGGDRRTIGAAHLGIMLNAGGVMLNLHRIFVIIFSLVIMILLYLFINRTTIGAAIEGIAQDKEGAQLVGINVDRMCALSFAIGTGLAGVGGALMAPLSLVFPTMGGAPLLIAFASVIFGGLGSLPGAALGAYLCGMVEAFTACYWSTGYKELAIFAFMMIVLIVLPSGLMGRKQS
jgi:branched-chain amino acid transport system permease protein